LAWVPELASGAGGGFDLFSAVFQLFGFGDQQI